MPVSDEEGRLAQELRELVVTARRGDRSAFDELVRRTYVDTYTLAVRLTGNEEDARDVVQETYLRAWKSLKRFRGDAAFTTWLYRITANASFTLVDRRRRRRTSPLDDAPEQIDTRVEARTEDLVGATLGLSELAACLDRLSPSLRSLVVLKDVYGLSHEEISDDLGISVSAAKVRLHRGRKQLREMLDESEGRDRADPTSDGRVEGRDAGTGSTRAV